MAAKVTARAIKSRGSSGSDRLRTELEQCHGIALLGFASVLASPDFDPTDGATFATAVSEAVNHYDLGAAEMALEFGVNVSTVTRWASGKNAPHPIVRALVTKWIQSKVEGAAEAYFATHQGIGDSLRQMSCRIEDSVKRLTTV